MTIDSEFRNPMDALVISHVRTLLDNPDIGIDDDLLAVGGNSIIAIRLGQVLRQELGISRIVGVIFKNPVLRDLSDALSDLVGR